MHVLPFSTDADVVAFAKRFLGVRVQNFRKDIAICLTPQSKTEKVEHTYFPALITCISFADFLSGLYAGKLYDHGLKELNNYTKRFMGVEYTSDRLDILYECFRHKLAHIARPYPVFDTHSHSKSKFAKSKFLNQQRRLIAWNILERKRNPPIEIVNIKPPKQVKKAPTPWPVYYDHKVIVSIPSLAFDIEKSTKKYLSHLATDPMSRKHFRSCIEVYFPRP